MAAALALSLLVGCQHTEPSPTASTSPQTTGEIFRGTKPEVIRLAIRAIQSKGWKLEQVNESVGIVSFETTMSLGSWSGVAANLIIEDAGPNAFRVSGTAKQNVRGGQLAAFDIGGEAQGVIREAIAAMRAVPKQ
jgi:hypothetical protein